MRLSARARYALRFMIDLAEHGGEAPVILREVAGRQRISRRYLEHVATGLRKANLILGATGAGGGYMLQRPPDQIRVLDIITAAVGQLEIVSCVESPELCGLASSCPSRRLWVRLHHQIMDVLGSIPLSELREGACALPLPTARSTPCTSARR